MEGMVVRRVIPSDNSYLFNAVGYVMDHDKNKAPELRQVIAATVASHPEKYNEAFLGKKTKNIVLGSLTQRSGEDRKYSERAMLIYDGLHYDALAMSPFEGAPEEFDQTIFVVQSGRTIEPVEHFALDLVKDQQGKINYTDTANFTWHCGVCQIGVVDQKEAVQHAQATGHVNFQEYR